MIVLDTNVVSEAMKPEPNPTVRAWLNDQAAETLYLSSVTLAELLFGIATLPAYAGMTGRGDFALAHHPAAANRKHLPYEATRWFAYEAPQRNLALQALLKLGIALNVWRKVSRVIDEVLCDCIHLNIMGCNLHADGLHVSKLSAPCGTIS